MPNNTISNVLYSMVAVALAERVARGIREDKPEEMSVEKMKERIELAWKQFQLDGIGSTVTECRSIATVLVKNSKAACRGNFDGDIQVLYALLYNLGMENYSTLCKPSLSALVVCLRSDKKLDISSDGFDRLRSLIPSGVSGDFDHWAGFYMNALCEILASEV